MLVAYPCFGAAYYNVITVLDYQPGVDKSILIDAIESVLPTYWLNTNILRFYTLTQLSSGRNLPGVVAI